MNKLSEEEIEFITKCLKEGKSIPDNYRYIIPFETKKEYELTYEGKEREEDILADTMAVPLQPVKTFGNNGNGWTNKLIFGDNLQVLKALMDDSEVYDKDTGRGKVRLIYIDPPFATRQEFRGSQDQKAYQDKIIGAHFLEFLRKRLVFLRELLADDGSIYVHLDEKMIHYVKALMDEIFDKNSYRNTILWVKGREGSGTTNLPTEYQNILLYRKRATSKPFWDPPRRGYALSTVKNIQKDKNGWFYTRGRGTDPRGRLKTYVWDNPTTSREEVLKIITSSEYKGALIGDTWLDISNQQVMDFPTEKPEVLLERIINASSEPDDIILDVFAGSGTTGVVAEKLKRRWIMIDCGKLAIYTMQKRLLNLRKEIGNRGESLKVKPFTLYNAGLYDYKMVKALPWDKYREFVLKLFQCRDEKHRVAGVELDGYLGRDPVMVFNYKKHKDVILDRGFIDDLHEILGDKVGYKFFVIAPAASVMFFEDYIEKGKTKYFALRIPYSIIDELHRKGFTHIKQPIREADVNDTIDAVGFDFIQIPDMECDYFIEDKKEQMEMDKSNKETVIKINKFKSNILSKKPLKFENRETLSMIMVDYDYKPEVFDLNEVFYAEDLKKNSYELSFDLDKIKDQIMLIYIDIFGNEKREVKRLKDFGRKRP
jgi:site-specific DNA-methyltransferase (adenine-specific)/adenine-specific DNA-methyltransferase